MGPSHGTIRMTPSIQMYGELVQSMCIPRTNNFKHLMAEVYGRFACTPMGKKVNFAYPPLLSVMSLIILFCVARSLEWSWYSVAVGGSQIISMTNG